MNNPEISKAFSDVDDAITATCAALITACALLERSEPSAAPSSAATYSHGSPVLPRLREVLSENCDLLRPTLGRLREIRDYIIILETKLTLAQQGQLVMEHEENKGGTNDHNDHNDHDH